MNAPFTLRPYQQEAVDATLKHFRQSDDSAVIVLPTGAGKSLVIAELPNWRVWRGVKYWWSRMLKSWWSKITPSTKAMVRRVVFFLRD